MKTPALAALLSLGVVGACTPLELSRPLDENEVAALKTNIDEAQDSIDRALDGVLSNMERGCSLNERVILQGDHADPVAEVMREYVEIVVERATEMLDGESLRVIASNDWADARTGVGSQTDAAAFFYRGNIYFHEAHVLSGEIAVHEVIHRFSGTHHPEIVARIVDGDTTPIENPVEFLELPGNHCDAPFSYTEMIGLNDFDEIVYSAVSIEFSSIFSSRMDYGRLSPDELDMVRKKYRSSLDRAPQLIRDAAIKSYRGGEYSAIQWFQVDETSFIEEIERQMPELLDLFKLALEHEMRWFFEAESGLFPDLVEG